MRVSRARIPSTIYFLLLLLGAAMIGNALQTVDAGRRASSPEADPATIFARGQAALQSGKLQDAEQDFRQVLQLDPKSAAAYANLGVVYMRRKQWNKAIGTLQTAERLAPQLAGVRLNIGLAYYRQNEFLKATSCFRIRGPGATGRGATPLFARPLLFFRRSLGGCRIHAGAALAAGLQPVSLPVCA